MDTRCRLICIHKRTWESFRLNSNVIDVNWTITPTVEKFFTKTEELRGTLTLSLLRCLHGPHWSKVSYNHRYRVWISLSQDLLGGLTVLLGISLRLFVSNIFVELIFESETGLKTEQSDVEKVYTHVDRYRYSIGEVVNLTLNRDISWNDTYVYIQILLNHTT